MFGPVVTRIDFEWIDYVILILDKSELNLKWFLFGFIYLKVNLTINLRLKSIVEAKSYKF